MSSIRKHKIIAAISYQKTALILLSVMAALTHLDSALAQIEPGREQTSTVVDTINGEHNISGGQTSQDGSNLFHSFEQFDLDTEQTANFVTNDDIRNIVGSIESSTASTINGTLQVSGSDANLYLINPAGILFGTEAQLNLSGGITATTATGIDFGSEQFTANKSSDYSKFVGSPTAFRFAQEQAGAVVNLGNLQVNPGQSIALIGGTVVNTGSLEAPSGTIQIAAVEGENLVRFSQEGHLLSFEIIADETVTGSSTEIPFVSISKMLASRGLSDATALLTDADGTVRLGSTNEIILEEGGSASIAGRLSTAGEVDSTINILGKQISLATATLDTSGDSRNGLIRIDTENIVVTDEEFPIYPNSVTYLSSDYIEGLSSSSRKLDIAASNDFRIEGVSDNNLAFERGTSVALTADSDGDLAGAFSMEVVQGSTTSRISSQRGRISIAGAGITAGAIGTDTTGTSGEGGGDITLISSRGVDLDSVSSNTYFLGSNAGDGGDITVEAGSEGITIRERIRTWSYSDGGNKAGSGGNINLQADGSIVVGDLISISTAGKNSSGAGGQISLSSLSGSVTVTGDVRSGSQAGKNNASTGGNVTIEANDNIDIRGTINTSSTARNANTDRAGIISLTAGDGVLARGLVATSSGKASNGDIILTGDRIDLLGGNGSVSGASLWFKPASQNQDINVGISTGAEETLDISTTDLAAIKTADRIDIGRADSVGRVHLFPEDIEMASSQSLVRVLGGEALAGAETGSIWIVDGFNRGSTDGFSFENIGSLEGGKGDDLFKIEAGGFLSGSVTGGDGTDTIAFLDEAGTEIAFSGIENVFGVMKGTRASENLEDLRSLDNAEILALEANNTFPSEPDFLPSSVQTALSSAFGIAEKESDSSAMEADMARSSRNGATEALAIADTFSQIELEVERNFRDYLGLSESSGQVGTVENVQKTLSDVEAATGVTPALVYAYFLPDAELERAAAEQSSRTARGSDQLEVMMISHKGAPIRRRQWGVTRKQLEAASKTLRQQVTSQFSTEREYLTPAQQLYDWIIQPIARDLEAQNVESIGFVMDDGLRTLPIAALHDGDRYLIEDYSLGLLPSFSLTEFEKDIVERPDLSTARVLAMGASEFTDQPRLPAVSAEIDIITQQLWQGDAFLNEDFVLKNLQSQIEQQEYGIVHLATHASFEPGNLDNSYIQMWDNKLSLSDMSVLGLNRSDISLIILSACNTALGDRASEYGFAGFAITAGSQSALASLWPVSDEGTLGFMSQFYRELKESSIKAEALRQAQISLINGDIGIDDGLVYGPDSRAIVHLPELTESGRWNFSHPFYWSAFTMIGNPW